MRTVSIYRSLLDALLLTVVLLSGAIFATTVLGARAVVETLSRGTIHHTAGEVLGRLEAFFAPAQRGIEVLRRYGREGMHGPDHPDATRRLLGPMLQEFPQFSSAIVADERGREFMLLRLDGRWVARVTRVDEWGGRSRWYEWTDLDRPPVVEEWRELGYDPRVRPWYAAARERGGAIAWTDPYRFFTTHDPGITASVTYIAADGVERVVAFDLLLEDLSGFTRHLWTTDRGFVFVLGPDGRLLGAPNHPDLRGDAAAREALLRPPGELGLPVVANAAWAARGGTPVQFESGGESWWAAERLFELAPGHALRVVVAVPEADLLGGVSELRAWILLFTALAIGFAAVLAMVVARRHSRPIEALVQGADRIRRGDLSPGDPVRTRVREVRRLARAQDQMREALRTLMRMERDLQLARQIQQDTFPRGVPRLAGFEIAAWSEPAQETGGDTHDVIGLRRSGAETVLVAPGEHAERALLLVADATGHGIGPALSVTQVRAMLRIAARSGLALAGIAHLMNEQLCADLTEGRFVTAWLGEVDAAIGTLDSLSAGQSPLLHVAGTRIETLGPDGPPFGVLEGFSAGARRLAMQPGDVFAVVSDGIHEARDGRGEAFGIERVRAVLERHRREPARRQLDLLREAVEEFADGHPADDDRTAILVRRR